MCSDNRIVLVSLLLLMMSCTTYKKIQKVSSGALGLEISVHDDKKRDEPAADEVIDSIRNDITEGPVIMNAVKDIESGEMVAVDVISASRVVARFRNVAERKGVVTISFDIHVPSEMADSRWQLKLYPDMYIADDTLRLDPLYVTGSRYRERQLRGYERYNRFMSSILTDSTDLIRMGQLEIFLQRNFPETYSMKSDSSFVSDSVAKSLFGVTQEEATRHYIRWIRYYFNERRKARADEMYERYVPDPIVTEGVRLDTVLYSTDGNFIYRYTHSFRSRPGLKKVRLALMGEIYENGISICQIPFSEDLTFYISSLASMADTSVRYIMKVIARTLYENVRANIDFAQGSAVVDTSLSTNSQELDKIFRCMDDVMNRNEYVMDSLVIVASCSPDGCYSLNRRLSMARSESVRNFMESKADPEWHELLKTSCVPEDWKRLRELVEADSGLHESSRSRILKLTEVLDDHDAVETSLSKIKEYSYLKKNIYPKLRNVRFDFHMHRAGMFQDTICTTEPDTVYMSGVNALKNMDYRKAVAVLGPYKDYNAALAFISADMNHSAMKILEDLDDNNAGICYLKALALSRLEADEEALKYFELSVAYSPEMEFRANLDPEMSRILEQRQHLFNF